MQYAGQAVHEGGFCASITEREYRQGKRIFTVREEHRISRTASRMLACSTMR